MKNLTLFPLLSHKAKIFGIILTILAVILLALEKMTHLVFYKNFTPQQYDKMLSLLVVVGLFLTSFSKEEVDDDRVRHVRAKALQVGFVLILSVIIALNFATIIAPRVPLDYNLSLIALIGISGYLITFNIGLRLDPTWMYADEPLATNVRNNKAFFLVYLLVFILLSISLLLCI